MKNYQVKLSLKESEPYIWRILQVPASLTYEAFHDVIQQAFGWENNGSYDISYTDVIISPVDAKANTELHRDWKNAETTIIQEDMKAGIAFSYHYDEIWEVKGEILQEIEGETYPKIIDWQGESVCDYCKGYQDFMRLKKNLKSKDRFARKEARDYFEEYVIDFDLDEINEYYYDMYSDQSDEERSLLPDEISSILNRNLQDFANLIQDLHKPYLFALKIAKDMVIYAYLDELENGKELMIFTDVSNFCRSVINVNESLSDMFFTDSLTIDFIEGEAEIGNAFFNEQKSIAFFRNAMGSAPLYPTIDEASVATLVIERLLVVIGCHDELPSLDEQRMCHISPDVRLFDKPFEVKEEICTINLQKHTLSMLKKLPQKQETMEVFLITIPNQDVENEHKLDTYCVFRSERFFEICDINTHEIMAFSEEMASHLIHVMKSFGLPKRMITNSINLAHSIEGFTSALKIKLEVEDEEESLNSEEFSIILERSGCSSEEQQIFQAIAGMDEAEAMQYIEAMGDDIQSLLQAKQPKLMN